MAATLSSAIDPLFAAIAKNLYGEHVDVASLWAISKAAPDASAVATPGGQDQNGKRKALVGGLVFGAAAEGAATARAARNFVGGDAGPPKTALGGKLRAVGDSKGGKAAELGLQAVNFGVGLAAAHELVKKPPQPGQQQPATSVAKARVPHVSPEALLQANGRARRAGLRLVGASGVAAGAGGGYAAGRHTRIRRAAPAPTGEVAKAGSSFDPVTGNQLAPGMQPSPVPQGAVPNYDTQTGQKIPKPGMQRLRKRPTMVSKRVDLVLRGEISKVDEDKRQAFGWASVAEIDGVPVDDLQGDRISIEEIEKSAYDYMLNSRVGGAMHQRIGKGIDMGPVHVADTIESFVVTPEKLVAMGLAPDALPHGWWLGQQINDEVSWQKVKSREWTGFSVHGSGVRKEVAVI